MDTGHWKVYETVPEGAYGFIYEITNLVNNQIIHPMIHHLITSNEINQQHIRTHLDHCLEKWI